MTRTNNAPTPHAIDRADALLKERLEAALRLERDRSLQGLKVKGVSHGAIQMDATGLTMTGRLRAIQLAWDIAEETHLRENSSAPPSRNSNHRDKGERP